MRMNELLKPNEGFNLNEAQVVGNSCCCHICRFERFWVNAPLLPPPQHPSLAFGIYSCFFPEVAVSPSLADGNVSFSSVFIGSGVYGKRSRASSVVPLGVEDPATSHPTSPLLPHPTRSKPAPAHVKRSALDMRGNNDVRKMGLDLCSLVSWEEL